MRYRYNQITPFDTEFDLLMLSYLINSLGFIALRYTSLRFHLPNRSLSTKEYEFSALLSWI